MPGLAALRQLRGATRVLPNQQSTQVQTIPPPIGGWNQRDTLPLMDGKDAITLDNFIPDTTSVHLRAGFELHATIEATATAVETLIEYRPQDSQNDKLFAAIDSAVYDVTAAATASSTSIAVNTTSNGRWYSDQMTNTGGHYLMIANGQDTPRLYNGSAWTTVSATTTGLTLNNIIGVHTHQNRFWMWEDNSLSAWYLDTFAIAGAATQFFPAFHKGGKLMAMGTWTRDGGDGSNSLAAFVTNRGECAIYQGFSPNSASDWTLVGTYNIPDVIGRRCIIKAGADLAILTMQGLVPLSQILGLSQGAASRTTITDKISGYFRTSFNQFSTLFGWETVEYPLGNLLLVNVPVAERVTQYQLAMNIYTGAWCRFTGMNAGCWTTYQNNLYFGGNDGKIYKYGTTTTDNGDDIIGTVQTAYSTYGTPATKKFTMAKPIILSPSAYSPPVSIQTDYDVTPPTTTVITAGSSGTQWDDGQWDTFQWAGGTIVSAKWQAVNGEGRAASLSFSVSSPETITFNGADIEFETGNFL